MKPHSKLVVTFGMATVNDDPPRFDQSWIPPGQTALPERKYSTTKLEPWLREFAYIYSGRGLDLTEEACHPYLLKEPGYRHEPNQKRQHGNSDTRSGYVDRIPAIDEASNISVKLEVLSYYSTTIVEDVLREPALRSPSHLPPAAIRSPPRPPEPPPEPPPRPLEPPARPSEPPTRPPEPPPKLPGLPPRLPEPPPTRQHSSSADSGSNSTASSSSDANCGAQNNGKPKKRRIMGCMRWNGKAERHDGMNEQRNPAVAPLYENGCSTPRSPHEHGQSVPRQSNSSLFSKAKTSLTRLCSGDKASDENRKDSKAGRDSRSTTRSLSSKLKQRVVEPLAKLTRHGSKDSHRPLSNSAPLSSSSDSTDLPTQHYLTSSSSSLGRTTRSSMSTLSSHTAYEKNTHCGLNLPVIPQGPPRPFQCTFCLEQCENKSDWMKHERSHFLKQGRRCMINNQDQMQLTIHKHDNVVSEDMKSWELPTCMDNWLWRCGFCDIELPSWDKRQDHIAEEHFENGCTMTLWNPLTSPCPRSKHSLLPIHGFPCWEQSALLAAIRQPAILDLINRVGETRPRNQCRLCKIAFSNFDDLSQHMTQWHDHPRSWSCPAPAKGSTFEDFFEPCSSHTGNPVAADNDICLYCGKTFSTNPPNLSLRKRHLEKDHHFNECGHEKFFKQDQFCRHLANSHNVEIEYMKDFVLSYCREDDRTPATGLVSG